MEQSKDNVKINVKNLNLFYGDKQALYDVILIFRKKKLQL